MSHSLIVPKGLVLPGESFDALLFDCDGTLVDTGPAHLYAYNAALRNTGLEMEESWYGPRFGLPPRTLLSEFGERHGKQLDLDGVVEQYSGTFQANLDRLREIPVVAELARHFRGRVPMAVASNGTKDNVARSLAAVGLGELFDLIVAIEDVENGKPAPDLYLLAAERLSVRPEGCIVFEDTETGLAAGRAAGMRVRDVREFI